MLNGFRPTSRLKLAKRAVQLSVATLPLHHHPSTAVPSLHIEGFGELQLWRLVLHGGVNQLQRSNVVVEDGLCPAVDFPCDTQLLVGASTVCMADRTFADSRFTILCPHGTLQLFQGDRSATTLSTLRDSVRQWRNPNLWTSPSCDGEIVNPNHSLPDSFAAK